jgi:AcrR family transcriptional regulator
VVSANTPSGRPRDPDVDTRITRAAVELFGRAGWARFSVDAIARASGVGKASIYLRWQTKEELLADALAARVANVADADTGSLRNDLVQLARQLMAQYLGDDRDAILRMGVEARYIPGIARRWNELRDSQVLAARAMVRRGIQRGEVPVSTDVTLLLDALCGGVIMHVTSTPTSFEKRLHEEADSYVVRLVDFLLARTTEST